MVATPRKVEIRDGKIELPEDLLEQSGIGTGDGVVIVDLRANGEIVVRASAPTRIDDDPVGRTAGIFREYAKAFPTGHVSTQEQIDAWKSAFEQGVADEVGQSSR
ncbi:MAG: hypothetical protein QM589_02080 [Thermomicrobiales bacterium]